MAKARSGGAKFTFTHPELVGLTAQQAVYKVGLEVLRDTKLRTPVRSGDLRRSYTYRRGNSTSRVAEGIVGTNIFYAIFVEFGTKYMRAQPHLGPALEAARMKYGKR